MLLLDTHVWVWSQNEPERLGRKAAKLLISPDRQNHVCAVSTLEIARLAAAGDLAFSMPLRDWVRESLAALAADTIPISHEIAMEAYELPGRFHKDPADRLLVAAARCHHLTLVTADERILNYQDVGTVDARR